VRVPSGEPELVRAGAAGDPAAVAALWDAYGARVFAFCQRVLGRADAAADAAQDAFLLAHAELGRLARSGEGFGVAVLGAARTTCYELLAREERGSGGRRGAGASLSAAAARLRPQQRAALALAGLEGLSYAEIATVLGIGVEGVGALLARARLRLHDELHGTALAGAAVRAPDCEDVVPLMAAAADGELGAADAAWADPHVVQCPTCPRTRRAMDEAAATYAAWSPAVPPAWLGAATLAEVGPEATGADPARRRAAGAGTAPRPRLSAALLGAALLGVAFAALLLGAPGSLRQRDPAAGGVTLPDAARSLRVARVPAAPAARRAADKRASHRARRARARHRSSRVAFVPVRAVRRVASAPQPPARRRPAGGSGRRPAARPQNAPAPAPSPATPAPAAPAAPAPAAPAAAPAPVSADAPADELPGASGSTTASVPASAARLPTPAPPKTTTAAPQAPQAPAAPAPAPPAVDAHGQDNHRGGGGRRGAKPCRPPPRCQRRSCRH
jgi:DNA-directed RNA polymerase specialized sigma24 family protein